MAEGAVCADDGGLMYDGARAVMKGEAGTDGGFVVEFDAHEPVDEQNVEQQYRRSQNPERLGPSANDLTGPQQHQHEATLGIARVGLPVLQNIGNHLPDVRMRVSFYIPAKHLPSAKRLEDWRAGRIPDLFDVGKPATAQNWIYQTWEEIGDSCDIELVGEMPKSGIIVTLANFLHTGFRASDDQFVAAVVADFVPHPGAQVQILQNVAHARRFPGGLFMPHWPQLNLIPRDPDRGERLETIAFFGDRPNVAPELLTDAFAERLQKEAGVRLEVRGSDRWHDYSDVDVAVAVRSFSVARHLHKPATKLYNAWLAGLPMIGGVDSAFMTEATDGVDYLVARTPDELISHLKLLKSQPAFRQGLVEAGDKRARAHSRETMRQRWKDLCEKELPERYRDWQGKGVLGRKAFWLYQDVFCFFDRKLRS